MATEVGILLAKSAKRVEAYLERVVPFGDEGPGTIHAAMRHSLLAGGKRLRPTLVLASARAAGIADDEKALPLAAALEMIHTYSLIHDDLPCMDDDTLRRGQPACHIAFGEATAILAGDALVTLAFAHLGEAAERGDLPVALFPRIVATLGRCAGTPSGMVAGQVADLEAEGKAPDAAALSLIHRLKTAALIEAACVCGGLLAEPSEETIFALSAYGSALGLTFQIVDDLLDVTESSDKLGKTAGKDAARGKATYPGVHGLETARKEARRQGNAAREALKPLRERGTELAALVEFVVNRGS